MASPAPTDLLIFRVTLLLRLNPSEEAISRLVFACVVFVYKSHVCLMQAVTELGKGSWIIISRFRHPFLRI